MVRPGFIRADSSAGPAIRAMARYARPHVQMLILSELVEHEVRHIGTGDLRRFASGANA